MKNWIVFKITTYICLVIALLISAGLVYLIFITGRKYPSFWLEVFIAVTIPCSQVAFQILNIRMLHHFLPSREMPDRSFRTGHTILFVFNLIWVILFCTLLVEAIQDVAKNMERTDSLRFIQQVILGLLITTIVLNVYSLLGALKLRSHLRFNYKKKENQWLEDFGKNEAMADV